MWTVPAAINPHNISPMCQETALYTWKVTARRVGTYGYVQARPACGLPDGGSPCCAATHSGLDIKLAAGNLLPSTQSIEQRARELKSYRRQPRDGYQFSGRVRERFRLATMSSGAIVFTFGRGGNAETVLLLVP